MLQTLGAKLVIHIPNSRVRDQDGSYRLDYWPPQGSPPPNSSFTPADVATGVELTRALPGTKYEFHFYYTNDTINDWPTWTANITTGRLFNVGVMNRLRFNCWIGVCVLGATMYQK